MRRLFSGIALVALLATWAWAMEPVLVRQTFYINGSTSSATTFMPTGDIVGMVADVDGHRYISLKPFSTVGMGFLRASIVFVSYDTLQNSKDSLEWHLQTKSDMPEDTAWLNLRNFVAVLDSAQAPLTCMVHLADSLRTPPVGALCRWRVRIRDSDNASYNLKWKVETSLLPY